MRGDIRSRKRAYAAMMGACLVLLVLSWTVVAHFSVPAAVVMAAVAMVIPPLAAVVANRDTDRRR
ncbi:DUF3099 domain-containing protein [Spirillospora sp. NPDC050679]